MHLRLIIASVLAFAAVADAAAQAPPAPPKSAEHCPGPDLIAAVRVRAGDKGDIPLQAVATELGSSEAAILRALPEQFRVMAAGSHFSEVWADVTGWDDAVFAVSKGGNVFEIHGRIRPGEPSKKSRYFNLSPGTPGVAGHLRPDLVITIAAVSRHVRGKEQHGIAFFDAAGAEVFGVYVPGEGEDVDQKVKAQYLATRERLRAYGDPCALPPS
ncbi:MAG: hypothetical protein IT483_02960 [Gammaproteobacteria bacterium]|nr:hypothetical protein [Gammaproteobacteria bacterium]